MGRLFRAYTEAIEPMPTPRKSRDAKLLVSPELAPTLLGVIEAFDRLYAAPYIDHGPAGAGSWRMRHHYDDARELIRVEVIEQVDDVAPPDHIGVCFECSLMAPPEGWSQPERRARFAAALATDVKLRPRADRFRHGGVMRKGWRDHMPRPTPNPNRLDGPWRANEQ